MAAICQDARIAAQAGSERYSDIEVINMAKKKNSIDEVTNRAYRSYKSQIESVNKVFGKR